MDILINLTTWLSNNFFGVPTFLLMLVVLVGHLLQGSPAQKTISGTLKAGIGFLVINSGTSVITGSLGVFQPIGLRCSALSPPPSPTASATMPSWCSLAAL